MAHALRRELINAGIRPSVILLFGSRANGKPRPDSDIDIAVVSPDFGKDRFEEGVKLNTLAHKINPLIEAIPVSTDKYLEVDSISPIIHEIKKTGIVLL